MPRRRQRPPGVENDDWFLRTIPEDRPEEAKIRPSEGRALRRDPATGNVFNTIFRELRKLSESISSLRVREPSDWNVLDRDIAHANDIREVTLTRHLPDPVGNLGEYAVSDGTNWVLSSVVGQFLNTVAKVALYTATTADDVIICDATGGAFSIMLPAAAGVTGKTYYIKKIDVTVNAVTVDANGAETIDDAATQVLAAQYDNIMIVSDGAEWWIV